MYLPDKIRRSDDKMIHEMLMSKIESPDYYQRPLLQPSHDCSCVYPFCTLQNYCMYGVISHVWRHVFHFIKGLDQSATLKMNQAST